WVASNTRYTTQAEQGPFDAAYVYAHGVANCRGFDDILGAILRKLGIPVQMEFGLVDGAGVTLPGPNGFKSSISWNNDGSAGLHTWINVWFPDAGWVPFDPQAEKFFIDTRHLGFWSQEDGGVPQWGSAQ